MLKSLNLEHVGPATELDLDFGSRLNVITGDNGLGKTFLLDLAWWAMTGTWVTEQAWPKLADKVGNQPGPEGGQEAVPSVRFAWGRDGQQSKHVTREFSRLTQTWQHGYPLGRTQSLIIYARVDEGFTLWEPYHGPIPWVVQRPAAPEGPGFYHFSREELWNGLERTWSPQPHQSEADRTGAMLCNGLIDDWVSWQKDQEPEAQERFKTFCAVLKTLSPDDVEILKPGKPVRVSLNDVRRIPTLETAYGPVPITLASEAVKRVLGLAYLLVWSWFEHKEAARIRGDKPLTTMTLLVDELEAHLHPKWQRSIVPALLEVTKSLSGEITVQVIATTHSPLVLASVEPYYEEEKDKIITLELSDGDVTAVEYPWAKQGDADAWLESDVFGLSSTRSKEAEKAIRAAYDYMKRKVTKKPPDPELRDSITADLQRYIPTDDPFLAGWEFFVKKEAENVKSEHSTAQ